METPPSSATLRSLARVPARSRKRDGDEVVAIKEARVGHQKTAPPNPQLLTGRNER